MLCAAARRKAGCFDLIALWGCPPHAGGYFLCGQKVTKKPPEPMVLDSFTRGRPNGTACLGGGFSDTLCK